MIPIFLLRFTLLSLISLVLLLQPLLLRADTQPFLISTNLSAPLIDQMGDGYFNLLMPQLLLDSGILLDHHLIFSALPPERALLELNRGRFDIGLMYVKGISERYPNLLMVPYPVYTQRLIAITAQPDIKIGKWIDLLPYRVAHISGWKGIEFEAVTAQLVTKVDNMQQLLDLLQQGRVDVIIHEEQMLKHFIKSKEVENRQMVAFPLESQFSYLYIHKKHADLLPLLEKQLQKLDREGKFSELLHRYLPMQEPVLTATE